MGVADVLAVRARTDLEGIVLHRAVCRAHIAEALATIAVPFTVGSVTVTAVSEERQPGGMWCLRVDGDGGNISWPVLIERPAILVADPAGQWMQRTIRRADGTQLTELVELPAEAPGPNDRVVDFQRYRFDPAGALHGMLTRLQQGT